MELGHSLPNFDVLVGGELDEEKSAADYDDINLESKHNNSDIYHQMPVFDKIECEPENSLFDQVTLYRDEKLFLDTIGSKNTEESPEALDAWSENVFSRDVKETVSITSEIILKGNSYCNTAYNLINDTDLTSEAEVERMSDCDTLNDDVIHVHDENMIYENDTERSSYCDNDHTLSDVKCCRNMSNEINTGEKSDFGTDMSQYVVQNNVTDTLLSVVQNNVTDTLSSDLDMDMLFNHGTGVPQNVIEDKVMMGKPASEGISNLDMQHVEYTQVVDGPNEGFPEKDPFLAVLGTVLVVMCIEIYIIANKHFKKETDLLEGTEDLGLEWLFQSCSQDTRNKTIQRNASTRSKAARKRKKQQQKLLNTAAKGKKNIKRFAENFEDLRRPVYEDIPADVDHSLTCPVCLEMYYLPCLCQPCGHIFCDPCLRRLTGHGSEGVLCPLCRRIIQFCVPDKDFNEQLVMSHPDVFFMRRSAEKRSKYRHFQLPFTPPTPLSERVLRHLVAGRTNLVANQGTLFNLSKFLFGCLTGACISVLIILLCQVRSVKSARDINVIFLSFCTGAVITFIIFKWMKL